MNLAKAHDRMLDRLGLGLLPRDRRAAVIVTVWVVLGVTAFIALLDLWLFRRHLAPDYVAFYTAPLDGRMLPMCLKALGEEVRYRLVLMTAMVAVLRLVRGRMRPAGYGLAALLAQMLGVWPLVLHDPLYATLRYLAIGMVWGLLYWRQGWLAAAAGHGLSHLLIDPVLLIGLTHTA